MIIKSILIFICLILLFPIMVAIGWTLALFNNIEVAWRERYGERKT